MNQLTKVFNYEQSEVRTVSVNNEPWFVAKDVCEILEIQNATQALHKLDEDERSMFNIGRQGEVNIVNEYGLYNLVLGSRKPEAKVFKRWITHEVIPTIRKHGVYATEELLDNPDFMIQALTALKEEREQKKLLQAKIESDKPKVLFADAVSASKTTILIGELAKLIKQNGVEIGQNRFFTWLRDNGYLIKRKGTDYNMPTQYSMELELFTVKETSITHSDGHITVNKTSKVTGKGQEYFINKFLSKNEPIAI
jgi:anti-repressor protein